MECAGLGGRRGDAHLGRLIRVIQVCCVIIALTSALHRPLPPPSSLTLTLLLLFLFLPLIFSSPVLRLTLSCSFSFFSASSVSSSSSPRGYCACFFLIPRALPSATPHCLTLSPFPTFSLPSCSASLSLSSIPPLPISPPLPPSSLSSPPPAFRPRRRLFVAGE